MPTLTVVQTIQKSDGSSVSSSQAFTGDGLDSRSVSVPDSSTDMLVNLAIDVSQIQAMIFKSDQAVTIETNDGTTPDDTISLTAGNPLVWINTSYYSNPLGTNVTAIYVTNSSGAAATLEIEVLVDATP